MFWLFTSCFDVPQRENWFTKAYMGALLLYIISVSSLAAYGQTSALFGDEYTVALENLPENVGIVVDPETQEERPTEDSEIPLTVTFDGVAEDFADLNVRISERLFYWPGGEDAGIPAVNQTGIDGQTDFVLDDWTHPGEILEFTFSTLDGGYISQIDDLAQSFVSVRGLEWTDDASAPPAESYLNSWYIYYSFGDTPFKGYDVQVDLGLLVGEHPFDQDVEEVAFIAYGAGQVEDIVEPIEGGVNLYFGTSQLDAIEGSWELLANALGFSGIEEFNHTADVTSLTLGLLVKPPVEGVVPGDCNGDGAVNGEDLACACSGSAKGEVLEALQLLEGDLDGDGTVAFADFLVLSANFNQQVDGYHLGDIDCDGSVQFADFLVLSANFGKTRSDVAAVPEPGSFAVIGFGLFVLAAVARRRQR